MANQMLIIFGIFVDRVKVDTSSQIKQANTAMAVFAFFLFSVYVVFGTMLAVFRNDIIKDNELMRQDGVSHMHVGDDDSLELPPENI